MVAPATNAAAPVVVPINGLLEPIKATQRPKAAEAAKAEAMPKLAPSAPRAPKAITPCVRDWIAANIPAEMPARASRQCVIVDKRGNAPRPKAAPQ